MCTVNARYVYQHEGRTSLGKGPMLGILGAGKWVRSKGHAMKSQWNAAMAAVDLMQVRYSCSCHVLDHVDMDYDHLYNDHLYRSRKPVYSGTVATDSLRRANT